MSVILSLMKELKQVKSLFVSGLLLLLLATAGVQLAPLILQNLIDQDLTAVSKGLVLNQRDFLIKLASFIGLLAIGGLLRYGSFRILMVCANQVATNLRNRAYTVMQRLPISYFDDKPAGKIATRIVNDTETLRNQFYSTLLSQIFITLIQVFFIYHQEEGVLNSFEQVAGKMQGADDRIVFVDSVASWTLTELLKYTVVAGILTFIGYQFLGGNLSMTAGRLFLYINYVTTLFDLLGMLVRQLPNIQRSQATGRRLLEMLEEQLEADEEDELQVTAGVVDFNNVSFAYDGKHRILKNISLHAKQGETVALVGHTGSGKTSIMNLLYRFYDPQEGDITIDGQDISQFSRESVRSQMGIVLQEPYLFTGSIASNVTMDKGGYSSEEIIAVLEKVGASDMLARLEKGIDEPVVEKGSAFSSGERQLIAFARTLIANPKILILDEATSHIDTETEEMIQKAMEVLKEGRTTFIIAHRLSTIQNADQILVLDAGQIIEQGNHDQLMQLNGRYAEMQRIQQKV